MGPIIKTSQDLKDEIYRLEGLEKQQALVLKGRFNSPSAIFSSIVSLFTNSSGTEAIKEAGFFKQDIVALISRFLLPITLNRTVFRKSNFLIKALVGVIAQRASKYINQDSVGTAWGKVKHLVEDTGKPNSFISKIKSLFEGKPAKRGYNHPATAIPLQQNILKPV